MITAEPIPHRRDGTELTAQEIERVMARLPLEVARLLMNANGGLVLAGGCIRDVLDNKEPKDIDLFACNKISAEYAHTHLRKRAFKESVVTKNAFTVFGATPLDPCMQIIFSQPFQAPYEVMETFDFEVCKASIWYDAIQTYNWASRISPRFREDLRDHRLTYCPKKPIDGGDSLLRVLKFYSRGYEINYLSLAQIMLSTIEGAGLGVDAHPDDATHALMERLAGCNDFTAPVKGKGSDR